MNDLREPSAFGGVSATPNIATRLWDRLCDFYAWCASYRVADGADAWYAQPSRDDPEGPIPNDLYFH